MKKALLFPIFMSSIAAVFAQSDSVSHIWYVKPPYLKMHHYFAIKAKFWLSPLLGLQVQGGIGFEYGFKDKNAFSIEYERALTTNENDTGVNFQPAPQMYHNFGGLILTYKRYFSLFRTAMYSGVFVRGGDMNLSFDLGYITDSISLRQIQYSEGVLLGDIIPIGKKMRIDVGLGLFYKEKYTHTIYLENGIITDEHTKSENYGIRASVDFMYVFHKRKSGYFMSYI